MTASSGLSTVDQGLWRFSQAGYNDGVSFGLSLVGPDRNVRSDFYGGPPDQAAPVQSGGELFLRARDWTIAGIGNNLVAYTDPESGITYPANKCRILVTGRWEIKRGPNSNSLNSIGCIYNASTDTNLGSRTMSPILLNYVSPTAVYVIQGSAVTGGAQDTFSATEFFCKFTETVTTDNSNRSFQSNTLIRPAWVYRYQRSWQID